MYIEYIEAVKGRLNKRQIKSFVATVLLIYS